MDWKLNSVVEERILRNIDADLCKIKAHIACVVQTQSSHDAIGSLIDLQADIYQIVLKYQL
jgi:hypothetical protein